MMVGQIDMTTIAPPPDQFDLDVETLIIGAGAAGMIAALAAKEASQSVLIIERDAIPSGSTALSAGLIPAAGTRFQQELGIEDDASIFAADIQNKADHENEQDYVELLTGHSASVIEWLTDQYGLPFSLVDDFDYPGHSKRRMHGLPTRSGQELIDCLRTACENAKLDIVTDAKAETLYTEEGSIKGVCVRRKDQTQEQIGCDRLILACNGYGGNSALVQQHMPDISEALWFGHSGNKGEAIEWGEALGAKRHHLGAYQGHGNVAHPHGILITWATITEGGFQVNQNGERFWDESKGYSEAARAVMSQPDGQAFVIFDERIASVARQFADFREAEAQGAVKSGNTISELANEFGLPENALRQALVEIPTHGPDEFGRDFKGKVLLPKFLGARVTGALFHTQGGLVVDQNARVMKQDGSSFSNLFAVGGAAVGVSGDSDSGYLSGNGLLSAAILGMIAGETSISSHS